MKDKDTYMLMEAYTVSQTKGAIISEGKVAEWIKSKILSKLNGFKEWLNGPGQQALKQHGILKEDFVFQESMGDWLKILGPVGIISALAVYLNMNPEVVQQVVDFFPDLMDQITNTLGGGEAAGAEAVPEPPVDAASGGEQLSEPTRPEEVGQDAYNQATIDRYNADPAEVANTVSGAADADPSTPEGLRKLQWMQSDEYKNLASNLQKAGPNVPASEFEAAMQPPGWFKGH